MKICGIYTVRNTVNGKVLIGSAKDIKRRWSNYKTLLNKGKYGNKYLQDDWNQYGADAFRFEVIEECEAKDLYMLEKAYMDQYSPDQLYNIRNIKQEEKLIRTGKEKEEFFEKWSEKNAGFNNPRYTGALRFEDVRNIKILLKQGYRNKLLAQMFGVKETMISRIKSGDRYSSISI